MNNHLFRTEIAAKVLLVDDDEIVRLHLGHLLGAEGYTVTTAPDAESALLSMQNDFAPIVILDINMPGMDGLALCRAIRRQTYSGYVYLMLHTSKDSEDDVLTGLDAGADDYISKLTPKSQLVGRLRTAQRILKLEHSLKVSLGDRERMAMTDVLTGVFNRRYLLQQLGHEVAYARRLRGELSVLVLDFDHFSHINDRHGHAAGDAVLMELVARIQGVLRRDCDWCARLGGDEFVAVLPQTDIEGASVISDKLLSAVRDMPMRVAAATVRMTVSIGASALGAVDGRDPTTAETLLHLADQSLYRSKRAGRNQATMHGWAGGGYGPQQAGLRA
jgi:two-component system cell cycle response regulator